MATKAELEAELDALKARMAEPPASDEAVRDEAATPDENAAADDGSADNAAGATQEWLETVAKDHGIDPDEVKSALEQLGADLQNLPRDQPMLAMALAFAVGFLAGRATK